MDQKCKQGLVRTEESILAKSHRLQEEDCLATASSFFAKRSYWQKPQFGWCKLNTDDGVMPDLGIASCGVLSMMLRVDDSLGLGLRS
ncbi:hypothetical protein V6N12_016367 [Hibiscus sabdariffa]|uniref:Uncharacterized protein n=1 Tax=Hibiscus sabdariffa TaxID=183260 RepID=A0ABR2CDD4_9ROSI